MDILMVVPVAWGEDGQGLSEGIRDARIMFSTLRLPLLPRPTAGGGDGETLLEGIGGDGNL